MRTRYYRNYKAAKRAERRARGLCIDCGVESQMARCDRCREKQSELRQRRWSERREDLDAAIKHAKERLAHWERATWTKGDLNRNPPSRRAKNTGMAYWSSELHRLGQLKARGRK